MFQEFFHKKYASTCHNSVINRKNPQQVWVIYYKMIAHLAASSKRIHSKKYGEIAVFPYGR
jgi:hypothetical protein